MTNILFYAASLLAGVPFGLLLKSQAESKLRGNLLPWLPFGASSLPRMLLGILLKILVVLPLFFAPLYVISEIGRHFVISFEPPIVHFLYFFGILMGKLIRFFYWRRKGE